ncbi:MAG: hypothetical protein AMXMBFR50_00280 [Ignavibacterium album]
MINLAQLSGVEQGYIKNYDPSEQTKFNIRLQKECIFYCKSRVTNRTMRHKNFFNSFSDAIQIYYKELNQ